MCIVDVSALTPTLTTTNGISCPFRRRNSGNLINFYLPNDCSTYRLTKRQSLEGSERPVGPVRPVGPARPIES